MFVCSRYVEEIKTKKGFIKNSLLYICFKILDLLSQEQTSDNIFEKELEFSIAKSKCKIYR